MKRFAALLAGAVALSGCSSLGMFAEGDLKNAAYLANLDGDMPAALCFIELGQDFAPTPVPADDGVFVLLQRKREVKSAITSGKCAPIVADVLLDVARRVPFIGAAVP